MSLRNLQSVDITPEQFELQVKEWIEGSSKSLESFEVSHLKHLDGDSGYYEIDVTAEFIIFGGAKIKILIECKKYSSSVKRDVIMVLESKLQDSNAHKGMVFSTSGFQSGAIEYANKRGIATITVQHGHTNYHTKSAKQVSPIIPSWIDLPDFIGWFTSLTDENNHAYSLVENKRLKPLEEWYSK